MAKSYSPTKSGPSNQPSPQVSPMDPATAEAIEQALAPDSFEDGPAAEETLSAGGPAQVFGFTANRPPTSAEEVMEAVLRQRSDYLQKALTSWLDLMNASIGGPAKSQWVEVGRREVLFRAYERLTDRNWLLPWARWMTTFRTAWSPVAAVKVLASYAVTTAVQDLIQAKFSIVSTEAENESVTRRPKPVQD